METRAPASHSPEVTNTPEYQRNKLIVITVALTVMITSLAWLGIGGLAYLIIYQKSPEFRVTVDQPDTVVVGNVFKMRITVENSGSTPLTLSNIDLYDELLDGFEVTAIAPSPRTTEVLYGYVSHEIDRTLKSHETYSIQLELRAEAVGVWGGDIDACTPGQNFITRYTEIEVVDAAPPLPAE